MNQMEVAHGRRDLERAIATIVSPQNVPIARMRVLTSARGSNAEFLHLVIAFFLPSLLRAASHGLGSRDTPFVPVPGAMASGLNDRSDQCL